MIQDSDIIDQTRGTIKLKDVRAMGIHIMDCLEQYSDDTQNFHVKEFPAFKLWLEQELAIEGETVLEVFPDITHLSFAGDIVKWLHTLTGMWYTVERDGKTILASLNVVVDEKNFGDIKRDVISHPNRKIDVIISYFDI